MFLISKSQISNIKHYLYFSFKIQIQDTVKRNLIYNSMKSIIKMGNLLEVETWQRLPLQDNYDFFSNEKLQESAPFSVKNLINVFNSAGVINNKNIQTDLVKLFDMYSFGKFNGYNV